MQVQNYCSAQLKLRTNKVYLALRNHEMRNEIVLRNVTSFRSQACAKVSDPSSARESLTPSRKPHRDLLA